MRDEMTLFCPSNGAWNALNTTWLFSPFGRAALEKIVLYHIVDSIEYFFDLIQGRNFWLQTRLEGFMIKVDVSLVNGGSDMDELPEQFRFVINNGEARIFETDLIARNGTVHRISSVLIPNGVTIPNQK